MTGNFVFSMPDLDLTGVKPKSITFNGKTTQISRCRDILTTVVTNLFYLDKNKLFKMAKDGWKPRRRIILTNDKTKLTRGFEFIKDTVYSH